MKQLKRLAAAALIAFIFACAPKDANEQNTTETGKKITIAMLPKLKGIPYFNLCEEGAKKAAAEENVTLLWDAPLEIDTQHQVTLIDNWLVRGIDALCLASNDPQAIAASIAKARKAGVHVLTWDTDSPGTEREYMVNQCDGRVLGRMLMDIMAEELGQQGQFAIITGGLQAENLNFWMKYIKLQHEEKYPQMKLLGVWPCDSNRQKAFEVAQNLMQTYPELNGIIGNDSAAFAGACDAIGIGRKAGTIKVTGLSMPSEIKPFVEKGIVNKFLLWDPRQLGYLTVKIAAGLARGNKPMEGQEIPGFGTITFDPDDPEVIIMAPPTVYTKDNIGQFDY